MTQDERNDLLLSILESIKPMILSFARDRHLDADDLYQEAAATILLELDTRNLDTRINLTAYMRTAIRHDILALITSQVEHPMTSLDAPLTEDSATSLADLIAAPQPVAHDEQREDAHTTALYQALRRLPLDEQKYLCELHQINAFHPRYACKRSNPNRSRAAIRQAAYKHLRRDTRLAAAL